MYLPLAYLDLHRFVNEAMRYNRVVMAKVSSVYICQQCGFRSSQFLGRCPECGTWNSLVEQVNPTSSAKGGLRGGGKIIKLSEVEKQRYDRVSTSLGEFDRVLGGGIVPGSLILVSGDPGIGKSTLLTQLALDSKGYALYVAGEESAQQIKIRAERINQKADLAVLNETDVDVICEIIKQLSVVSHQSSDKKEKNLTTDSPAKGGAGLKAESSLVIVDSIQTLETSDLNSVAGSVGQVRECAHRLQRVAKSLHVPIFLVGHVTKEGTIAGPKTLEHLVDVVLSLEGESTSNFRILRSTKNRFGPTDEVGIFEMEESGMVEVTNPSKMFLDTKVDAPGSVVVATLTGQRPILVEIQALVTKSFLPAPRRTGSGIDNNRLQLLVAVLQKRLGLPLFDQDIFVNVTGGLKVFEPAADLAICLAVVSSLKDKAISGKTVVVGEVGLLGEVREVRGLDKRATEAKKLGFTNVISSQNAKSLAQAVKLALG